MHRTTKTSTISFRIAKQLKKRLENAALRERRTLSSVIVGILQDSLDSREDNTTLGVIQEDRRDNARKQVLLPARWRIRQEDDPVEHDVLLKNISVGGAYTEYINGQGLQLIKDLQVSPLELVVRMPGSQWPIKVACEVSRIHITGDCMGVGLRLLGALKDKSPLE